LPDALPISVLHAGAGVGEFALAPDLAPRGLARAFEQDEGRVADQIEGAGESGRSGHGVELRRGAPPRNANALRAGEIALPRHGEVSLPTRSAHAARRVPR